MSYFVKQTEDKNLPDWLQDALGVYCPVCGHEMMNYYNDHGQCTNRRCSNEYCPSMLAERFVGMCKVLSLKEVGYKTALRIIQTNSLKSHVDVITYVLDDVLTIPLSSFLRSMEFEGVDSQWVTICDELEVCTLDELFEKYYGDYRYILDRYKDELYRCVQFFNLSGPKVVRKVDKTIATYNIMITGTPTGFASKEHFVDWLNSKLCGAIKIVHVPHARKTNVSALIRENSSKTKTKLAAAQAAGIPILTSEEFIQVLTNILVQEMKKQGERTV